MSEVVVDPRDRAAQLADALSRVRARVGAACAAAGRETSEVSLVAVTKFFPASDVAILASLGVHDVGESRDQEASAKVGELAGLLEPADRPRVHFVGQLQTNKAASVARYADVVQSVDRVRLVTALQAGAERAGRRLDVFVQVDLDDTERGAGERSTPRGGARPDRVAEIADAVAAADRLELCGVMAVAPLDVEATAAFDSLLAVSEQVRRHHPRARMVSAGMSDDLEAAVAAGSTHLRVGRAILGSRPRRD